jgi:hypothetical protein
MHTIMVPVCSFQCLDFETNYGVTHSVLNLLSSHLKDVKFRIYKTNFVWFYMGVKFGL